MMEPPLRDEVQELLDGEEGAFGVDVEDLVELLFGHLTEGDEIADAGVGEDDVDAAVFLRDVVMQLVEVCEFGDVADHSFHVLANGFDGFVGVLLAASGNDDLCAFFGEEFGGGEAHAAVSAGNEGDFSF